MTITDKSYTIGNLNLIKVDNDPRSTPVTAGIDDEIIWVDGDSFLRKFIKLDNGSSTNVREEVLDNQRRFAAFPDFNPVEITEQATVANWDDPANEVNWANGTLLEIQTGQIQDGFYLLNPQCIYMFNSTNKKFAFRTVIDGISLGALPKEIKDINIQETENLNIYPRELEIKGIPYPVSWAANGDHNIKLQAIIEAGSPGQTKITFSDCAMQLIKVG